MSKGGQEKMLRLEKELREKLKDKYEERMMTSVSIAQEIAVHAHRYQKDYVDLHIFFIHIVLQIPTYN